jgi:hypothetical protein
MKEGAMNHRKPKNVWIAVRVAPKIMAWSLMNKKKMMFLVMDQLRLRLKLWTR